jgi:hypothetical protein
MSSFPRFWIERYGFTDWDCIMLVSCVRESSVDRGEIPSDFVAWLTKTIDWDRQRSVGHEDILKTPTGPAEIKYLFHDLIEKLQSLNQQQARDVVMYALGWQDGMTEAAVQRISRDLDERET